MSTRAIIWFKPTENDANEHGTWVFAHTGGEPRFVIRDLREAHDRARAPRPSKVHPGSFFDDSWKIGRPGYSASMLCGVDPPNFQVDTFWLTSGGQFYGDTEFLYLVTAEVKDAAWTWIVEVRVPKPGCWDDPVLANTRVRHRKRPIDAFDEKAKPDWSDGAAVRQSCRGPDRRSSNVPPQEIQVFEPRIIARGPDAIRGQVGSHAFIYTRYPDPEGNRWFVRLGHIGHEEMTNTRGMLRAFFGPEAGEVTEQVVTVGEVYAPDARGYFAPTGARREVWDWRTIRLLAKRENLFGRSGILQGRRVVMLWGDPPGWETMLVFLLGHIGVEKEDDVVVVVGDYRQFWAKDFYRASPS